MLTMELSTTAGWRKFKKWNVWKTKSAKFATKPQNRANKAAPLSKEK
jgi:hypothetical protein